MSALRRAELISGIFAGALGLLGVGAAVFLPIAHWQGTAETQGHILSVEEGNQWLVQRLGAPMTISLLMCFGLVATIVTIAAILHQRQNNGIDYAVLVMATLLLMVGSYLVVLVVGPQFLPSGVVALVAAFFATIRQLRPTSIAPR